MSIENKIDDTSHNTKYTNNLIRQSIGWLAIGIFLYFELSTYFEYWVLLTGIFGILWLLSEIVELFYDQIFGFIDTYGVILESIYNSVSGKK